MSSRVIVDTAHDTSGICEPFEVAPHSNIGKPGFPRDLLNGEAAFRCIPEAAHNMLLPSAARIHGGLRHMQQMVYRLLVRGLKPRRDLRALRIPLEALAESFIGKGLDQVIRRAEAERMPEAFPAPFCRHRNYIRRDVVFKQVLHQLFPGIFGHTELEEHKVHRIPAEKVKRFAPVCKFARHSKAAVAFQIFPADI